MSYSTLIKLKQISYLSSSIYNYSHKSSQSILKVELANELLHSQVYPSFFSKELKIHFKTFYLVISLSDKKWSINSLNSINPF